jgi:hypothetical protein
MVIYELTYSINELVHGVALAALVLAHQNFTDDSSKSKGFKREVVVLTHGAYFYVLGSPVPILTYYWIA